MITLDNWIADLAMIGRSDATLAAYAYHAGRFVSAMADRGLVAWADLTPAAVRAWAAGLRKRYAPATCKQAIGAARSLLTWAAGADLAGADLAGVLKMPRVPARRQRTLTAAEISILIGQCDPATPKGARDAAMISLLADSGLRAAELIRLDLTDLDLAAGRLDVVRKGGSIGRAYFGDTTAARIRVWLRYRPPAAAALFLAVGGSTPGDRLTTRGLRIIVKRIGDQAGVAGVSPHAFRRGFACLLVEAGANSRMIQALGGWADIRQIERYTQALDVDRLARSWSPMDRLNGPEQLTLFDGWRE